MIYVYVASKARIGNLFAHINLAKAFATPFIRTTRFGYCLTTLEIALKLLTENEDIVPGAGDDPITDAAADQVDFDDDNLWQERASRVTMSMRQSIHEVSASADNHRSYSLDLNSVHKDFIS